MNIADSLRKLISDTPESVSIIAVSKRKSVEDILEAYEAGQRIFGENRVQELSEKHPQLPDDIEWHMVGHLQTNKVKYIAGFVHMVQSIDSLKLLLSLEREAKKADRIISCLLQIHIAREETKFGFTREEVLEIATSPEVQSLNNVRITGVMGMATFTEDEEQVRSEFRHLSETYNDLKENCFSMRPDFKEISMGMSGDFQIAIEEGSTMVRLGTIIFGERNY
jgi:pyridoxal phosphate enzyme (YggS family)